MKWAGRCRVLEGQYERMREFARFIAVHVCSVVVGDPEAVMNAALVRELKLKALRFDPQEFGEMYERAKASRELYDWSFDARKLTACLATPAAPAMVGSAAD